LFGGRRGLRRMGLGEQGAQGGVKSLEKGVHSECEDIVLGSLARHAIAQLGGILLCTDNGTKRLQRDFLVFWASVWVKSVVVW
jgi:hypothetical protein